MITEKEIIENLRDAGCNENQIEEFLKCFKAGENKKGMKLIKECRKQVLSEIHENQRKIDCLDFFVYEINKTGNI